MSASLTCSVLAAALLAQATSDRPRFRDAAEPRDVNVARYRLVDELEPIVQAHSIEGLMMGEA